MADLLPVGGSYITLTSPLLADGSGEEARRVNVMSDVTLHAATPSGRRAPERGARDGRVVRVLLLPPQQLLRAAPDSRCSRRGHGRQQAAVAFRRDAFGYAPLQSPVFVARRAIPG